MLLEEVREGILGKWNGVHAVLVELLNFRVVRIVLDVLLLLVAPTEDALHAVLVQLPLLNVLGHVLHVGPQHVVDIHHGVVAREVHHGDVEINAQLRVRVGVEYDICLCRGAQEGHQLHGEQRQHEHPAQSSMV